MKPETDQSSFRDRDGFVFYKNGDVFRAIHVSYKPTWDQFIRSDLYTWLTKEGKLPSHSETDPTVFFGGDGSIYKVLQVQKIPFISYPSEWSFGQLKKAALLTLEIQKKALASGLSLKDASAYNIQFNGPQPVFIDLLSFDTYTEGEPWVAYGQFCRHFLGPLLLQSYGRHNLQSLFIDNIDGPPLSMVAELLPWQSRLNMLAYTHIHLHARFENKHAGNKQVNRSSLKISRQRSLAILEHLEQGIRGLRLKKVNTNWTNYYDTFSYSRAGYEFKRAFIEKQLSDSGKLCVDLGANTGEFSEIASKTFGYVVACDSDMEVVRAIQAKKNPGVLALKINLDNPTPSFGWNNEERSSFISRCKNADMVLALALVHHLCIGNNVPLPNLAAFFAGFSRQLIIEFVPKNDVQVKKLLVTKKDVFADYTYDNFLSCFSVYYNTVEIGAVPDSDRILLLLKRK